MSGASSKRQQARNERALQELIKSIPGNNVCADCQARNPGWASWSLGIFLCMRCAALHRKLGTHITKVKSLSMDSWSSEQVEHMKRVGNVASNRIYNPQNTRPPVPFDADEADSAMERFIRQKYQEKGAGVPARHNTGSTNSDDPPPPLPLKPGSSRFGFRSASSIFPLSSKSRKQAAAAAQSDFEQRTRSPSPDRRNKPSKIFGTSVGQDDSQDLDMKLAKLRDMGFRDEKRNMTVLKGMKGNLEKSIETLVRLGEGSSPAVPAKSTSGPLRSRTPVSSSTGLVIDRTREREQSKPSSNPFDGLDPPRSPLPPQSSQSTGSIQPNQMGNNPFQQTQTSNPFGLAPSQSQYSLNQSFQNMAVSPSQPLFPNRTGGFPAQQQSHVQQLYQQSMTPPVPSIPQQYHPSVIYENPAQQPQQNYNPFMQQQQIPPINTNFQSNPYAQNLSAPAFQTQNIFNSPVEQSPMQQQGHQAVYDDGFHQQAQVQLQQQPQQSNPFFQNSQQQTIQQHGFQGQQQTHFQQQRQATFPLMPQQTGRADKRSILDLYNYPQLAPTPLHQLQTQSDLQNIPAPMDAQQQQRSVSNPVPTAMAGSRNPFMNAGGSVVQSPVGDSGTGHYVQAHNGVRHVTQESASVDTGGWTGRHSPDAWGTISSRSAR